MNNMMNIINPNKIKILLNQNSRIIQLPQYNYSQYNNNQNQNIPYNDLLKQQNDNLFQQQQKKSENIQQPKSNDPTEYYYSTHRNLNVKERYLQDDEIKRNTKETFKYENKENPFLNAECVAIQKLINEDEEIFRDWQYNFQKQYKRKPSLRDMQDDSQIKSIIDSRSQKQFMQHINAFRYRIN